MQILQRLERRLRRLSEVPARYGPCDRWTRLGPDVQLERIEARLRTLTILQQRTRLQVERIAEEIARLATAVADREASTREEGAGR
jgi:hypothetical protein